MDSLLKEFRLDPKQTEEEIFYQLTTTKLIERRKRPPLPLQILSDKGSEKTYILKRNGTNGDFHNKVSNKVLGLQMNSEDTLIGFLNSWILLQRLIGISFQMDRKKSITMEHH